ncbi:hypothetical protein [Clostridioides sp. ES-S-0049-02]
MRLYSTEYIESYINKNKHTKGTKELSKEIGYSAKWIKCIMNKQK